MEAAGRGENVVLTYVDPLNNCTLGNPSRVRSKGCGATSLSAPKKNNKTPKRVHRCGGVCGKKGHNKMSCQVSKVVDASCDTSVGLTATDATYNEDFEDCDYDTIEMVNLLKSTCVFFSSILDFRQ